MAYILRDLNPDDPDDARRVAEMFNDFDSAWPGGFTRGVSETAERVAERKRSMRRLAVCVVECDGEFVGYADLDAQEGQKDIAYLPLLGARLSHHGRGVGKMLLREIVHRTAVLGYRQLVLDTWAGNTKAVPLYKKTGFFWVPETSVLMRNFLPTILTVPAGRAFFAHRDWYGCFDRDLAIAPDDVKWKGMKVYPYRFRDGDEYLHMTFHADSQGLTAIETPAYAVSCIIPTEEAPAGEIFPVVWEIEPRGGRTLDVVLLAEGEPGLELSVQERIAVRGRTEIGRDMRVSPDARPRRRGETAHRVRSTLIIDGDPIVLETGAKVVHPVEIQYGGQGLFPGRREKVDVRLRNRLSRDLEGVLALDPHPCLLVEEPAHRISLPARSWTQCSFDLQATEPGVFPSALRLAAASRTPHGAADGEEPRSEDAGPVSDPAADRAGEASGDTAGDTAGDTRCARSIAFRAFAGAAALASIDTIDDEYATLESPSLRVTMQLRGGSLGIHINGPGGRWAAGQEMGELGPPFKEWRMRPSLHRAHIEQTPNGASLVLVAPSAEMPGLVVERTVSIPGPDLVRIDYRVINTSGTALPAKLRVMAFPGLGGTLVQPLPSGLIREPLHGWGHYPEGETDPLAHGARFDESWTACEEEGRVCGMVWAGEPEQLMQWSRYPHLIYDLGELAPHSSRSVAPIYLVAGGGDWKTVRDWWRRLVQPPGVHEFHAPEPMRVLSVEIDPSPSLLVRDREEIAVAVVNRRGKALDGRLRLSGEGLVEPAVIPLEGINRDKPFRAPVRLSLPGPPRGVLLSAEVETEPYTEAFSLPALRLGSGDRVDVAETDGVIAVDNGWMAFRIAPGFLGSMISLEREGVNHLHSAYPERRPFVWVNPWYGGVHPFVGWAGDEKLPRETFTGQPVEIAGDRGLRWHGARLACEPEHKDLRWLRLEVDYLTVPGSNVAALVSRWTNRTDARMSTRGDAGFGAWLAVGGDREKAIAHYTRDGERRHRRRGGFDAAGDSGPWAAVANGESGDTILLIVSDPRARTKVHDLSKEGPHLAGSGPVSLGPNETKETVTWLVLSQDVGQIDAYASLAKVRRLP